MRDNLVRTIELRKKLDDPPTWKTDFAVYKERKEELEERRKTIPRNRYMIGEILNKIEVDEDGKALEYD